MEYRFVKSIFGKVICPHCNEPVIPRDEIVQPNVDFGTFHSKSPDSKQECLDFNNLLNEKMFAFQDGHLTRQEIEAWASQYTPQ